MPKNGPHLRPELVFSWNIQLPAWHSLVTISSDEVTDEQQRLKISTCRGLIFRFAKINFDELKPARTSLPPSGSVLSEEEQFAAKLRSAQNFMRKIEAELKELIRDYHRMKNRRKRKLAQQVSASGSYRPLWQVQLRTVTGIVTVTVAVAVTVTAVAAVAVTVTAVTVTAVTVISCQRLELI